MLYFIVNESSRTGKGKNIWKTVKEKLDASNVPYEFFKTEYVGHATKLAEEICEKDDDDICLISVGGDGTMNEVINGMTNFDRVRFGVIPSGSGNDFRRGLKLPKDPIANIDRILSLVNQGKSGFTRIDLGQVTWEGCHKPRLYGISAGVGMDAIVCKKALTSKLKKFLNKIKLGKLTYVFLTVQTLFSMETVNAEITFLTDKYEKKVYPKKLIFAASMNLYAEGGGVPMAPKGNPFDGLLSTCYANGIPKWLTFLCLPILVTGNQAKLRGFGVKNSGKVHMKLEKPFVLHADGEYLADVKEVTFECLKEKLMMLM